MHNDPRGLGAHGCAGPGVGYAADASWFTTCGDSIWRSVALQLGPHHNVTAGRRLGPHAAISEPLHVRWSTSDNVGLYANGSNTVPITARDFKMPPKRPAGLADGKPHEVMLRYTGSELSVWLDGEDEPSLTAMVDLAALGAADAAGASWVGFTASTGATSIDADLLSFAFCETPGCAVPDP